MAKVTDVFVSGTVENLVLYRRMGINCSRMKRDHIKQTVKTKIRGINFGIASRAGKGLRSGLTDTMPFLKDRRMQSRFSGSMAKWLVLANIDELPPCDAVPYLGVFSFTNSSYFTERFKVPIAINQPQDNLITVSIDAFVPTINIKAPAGTASITCTIAVAGCLLKTGISTGSKTISFVIPYNDVEIPAHVLEFPIPVIAGSLTVTAARLDYKMLKYNSLTSINNPAFMPAGIINARFI